MSEYPATHDILEAFLLTEPQGEALFYSWLAEVQAAAWWQGFGKGSEYMEGKWVESDKGAFFDDNDIPTNPYEAEEGQWQEAKVPNLYLTWNPSDYADMTV